MAQKFNNQHYCTKGISQRLPIMTQVILWEFIQSMKIENQDPSLNKLLQSEALALSLAETAGGAGSEDV